MLINIILLCQTFDIVSNFIKIICFLFVLGCVKLSCLTINGGPESSRKMQLQYLDLTDCSALQDTGLRVIVRNCPQLAYLYLRRCIQITGSQSTFTSVIFDTQYSTMIFQ